MKKKKHIFVSIIIPFYVDVPRFYQDLKRFSKLSHKEYEILVVTDRDDLVIQQPKVRVISTGLKRTGPAEKRDIALKYAKGDLCAFIDDDAYPKPDWLDKAIPLFESSDIAAVGGPGITPKEDGFWEQLTGLVYSSFFCSGYAQYRFVYGKKQLVDDYPAYNLIVEKQVLKKVGGYGSHFYGGEDTFLCLKIVEAGYKIIYSPEVVVYHHRRPLFIPYLSQIGNVGRHRGYFARKYPSTSRRFGYFVPSILAFSLFGLFILSLFSFSVFLLTLISLSFFVFLGAISIKKQTSFQNSILVGIAIILTHISYGVNFLQGFMTKELSR